MDTPPGIELQSRIPGQRVPKDGVLTPNNAPGFGLEIPEEWFEPFFALGIKDKETKMVILVWICYEKNDY